MARPTTSSSSTTSGSSRGRPCPARRSPQAQLATLMFLYTSTVTWQWKRMWHDLRALALEFFDRFAAARLVTGAGRRDHITPVLRQLHWLPVRQRMVFKVAGLVHQSLEGVAPAYLMDDCRLLSDASRRPLRSSSSDIRTLVVPRTHNKIWR